MPSAGPGRIGLFGESGSESGSDRSEGESNGAGEAVVTGVPGVEDAAGGEKDPAVEAKVEVALAAGAACTAAGNKSGRGASLSLLRRNGIGRSCGPSHCPGRSGMSLNVRSGSGRPAARPPTTAAAADDDDEDARFAASAGATNRNASSSIRPARSFIELVCFQVTLGGSVFSRAGARFGRAEAVEGVAASAVSAWTGFRCRFAGFAEIGSNGVVTSRM